MDGCVAQTLGLVGRLILCGAMPSIGRGVNPSPHGLGHSRAVRCARTQQEHRAAFLEFCFLNPVRVNLLGRWQGTELSRLVISDATMSGLTARDDK